MKAYSAYLIDLDGTMYRGNQVIEEAPGFIQWLNEQGIPFLFLTNNSSLTPQRVAHKLGLMGITCGPEHVYTTSMAAAHYISSTLSSHRVYAIGEAGLIEALQQEGCELAEEQPEVVVVGIDREITYEKMAKASLAIQGGAHFLSTNSDRAIPTERGLVPGNGALTAAISVACGKEPQYIGKPESLFVHLALEKLGVNAENVLLVGDNLQTDIAAGVQAQVDTLLVYTGITRPEDLELQAIKPTYAVDHLKEWTLRF
ncbi:TIGR01457 family HAD-type hydrolase [Ammoniphilus sp. CFH 90114]|uniref:TIGR01457 family HAD-type hydrolase n=1 Tax=Ammoniphilus sp. CFH 90114 TaxID=2493665 RepID=UPI00100F505F|nr:TIGR01457 family HAD-type hydrolase [Ammoniphilus sp. CFH 90114]RXT05737.1 TIGR01457 family HAD-type hydrolase [Ammoniphilus sp. CFH 90114]